ncbi:hypothetical protein D3M71_10800 [Erwinia billingiae]|nr:hypothetical protein [Erwinia billingiae]
MSFKDEIWKFINIFNCKLAFNATGNWSFKIPFTMRIKTQNKFNSLIYKVFFLFEMINQR